MKRSMLWLVMGSVAAMAYVTLRAKSKANVNSKILLQSTASWNDVEYGAYPKGQPELTTVRIAIPAHSALPWHTHSIPNAAYILSGQLTIEERTTGRKATYGEGEAFAESVGDVHRGITGSAPVVAIVTYAGSPGVPLSTPDDDNSA